MSGSVIIEQPQSEVIQLIFLKMHLSLHAKGMGHSRMSGTSILEKTGGYLGKSYRRGQYQQALDDVLARLDQIKTERETVG